MFVTIITCAGLVCSVLSAVPAARARLQHGVGFGAPAIAWGALFCILQAFIAIWSAMGLVQQDMLSALVLNVILSACACASFNRHAIEGRLRSITDTASGAFPHPVVVGVLLMLLAGACTVLGLELSSNHALSWMYPLCLLLEFGLIAGVLVGLYLVFQRRGGISAAVELALYAVGVAEYFVITFKSMPISPGDLSALSTAAAVAGTGYTYTLSAFCLYALGFTALAMMLSQLAGMLRPGKSARSRRALVVNLVVGLAILGGVGAHVTLIDYYHTLGIQVYTWRPLESYYRQGFLPAFISGAQTINPPRPQNYSVETAEELIDRYSASYDEQNAGNEQRSAAEAQFDQEKPTVIAIMNETFSDLSIYQQMHAGYTGPEFFKSLDDCLQRGRLYVSAYGGGTANTEYEFLTGNSMSNLGSGVYPYTIYNLTDAENLAAQFKELGYDTTAMHPNHATNWNRENVYEDFGFDRFLSIEDFEGADTLRGMVTDRATYDKIIDLLNSNEDPQFIFDVTMQNHSGYTTGLIPADQRVELEIDGMSDMEINEYVSLIQESDKALSSFIEQLRNMDRKVIVVFFGDHQPYFPSRFNDLWFTGEDEAVHQERLWQTDYIIWANYDVAGNDQVSETVDLSTNYLGSTLMQLIGAPLTDYQKSLISLREAMPAINTTGYEDADGTWYLSNVTQSDGTPAQQTAATARQDYAMMQYYEMFYDGKEIYTKRYQAAANETNPNLDPGTTKIQ